MVNFGDWISFVSGVALMVMAAFVMKAYSPRNWNDGSGSGYLAIAIWLSFAAALGNTLYWQVFAQPAVQYGLISVPTLRNVGDYFDVLFKGGGAVAGYLHLKALHAGLPTNERKVWGVLEMAFYPRRRLCLRLLSRTIRRDK